MGFPPPCTSPRHPAWPAFINPSNTTPDLLAAATRLCATCPIRRTCARQALTAGTTLDRAHPSPAIDVIQAGIICDGTTSSIHALAAIAHCPPPDTRPTPRTKPPTHCKGCGRPMVVRDKSKPTRPDVLTHAAHGYCRVCDARRRRQPGWQSTRPRNTTVIG